MLIPVLLFIVGLLFLIKGGDWFVDGASSLARRFHLPELLIGATVVSIGTTLPEVMVSTMSALSGHGEIAYGNAIGSVICANSSLSLPLAFLRFSENFKKRSVPPPSSTHTTIIMIGNSNLSTSLSLPQLIVPNHPRPPVLIPAHRYSLATHPQPQIQSCARQSSPLAQRHTVLQSSC